MGKHVLLIGGGGTLGTYTAEELLKLGHLVDVICLEDKNSEHADLTYYKGNATASFLQEFLSEKQYDGIVNFIHYREVEDYEPIHALLIQHTEHLVFLSSYRVYGNLQIPITEDAPMLLDVIEDESLVQNERYAVSKTRGEKYLREKCKGQNWTIVRPVISFSQYRLDLIMCSGKEILEKTKKGEPILLPEASKNLTAGLDWAGNTGKLIAHLLFKKETYGEAYTISSAQNLTWGQVADIYEELIGAKFEWLDTESYLASGAIPQNAIWRFEYDRLYDRNIDNSKVLSATNLSKEDFVSMRDGIKMELQKFS